MTAKFNERYNVSVFFDEYVDKNKLQCVNLWVRERKRGGDQIKIPFYDLNGERLKLKKDQLIVVNKEVTVIGVKKSEELTKLVRGYIRDIKGFTATNAFTKQTLYDLLYKKEFLGDHKRKRTKFLDVEITGKVPTNLYNEFRRQYPKRREVHEFKSIDKDGFEVVEQREVIIDPLSLENFPEDFNHELYEKFKTEMFKDLSDREELLEQLTQSMVYLNASIAGYIEQKFYTEKVNEVEVIDKKTLQDFKKENPSGKKWQLVTESPTKGHYVDKTNETLVDLKKKNLPTKERFEKGFFDKNNIFEVFASIKYNPNISPTFNKIIIRLYQFRFFCKPKENVKYVDKDWFTEFFTYLWKTGYYNVNTVGFDAFKFDGSIFNGKRIMPYTSNQIHSLKEITMTVINKLIEEKLLTSKIELPKITKITGQSYEEGKRIEHTLSNNQFNQLYTYKPSTKKLQWYNQTFQDIAKPTGDNKNKFQNVVITLKHIETVKDMFCLMVMSGGLRGYSELSSVTFNKQDDSLIITSRKVKKVFINPLNAYSRTIAKKYNWIIPKLIFETTNSDVMKEEIVNFILKVLAQDLKFDTPVIYNNEEMKIMELFSSYFARKTFSQIMDDEYGFNDNQIAMFTGHIVGKNELNTSYLQKGSREKKKKLFDQIKAPK